MTKTNDMLRDHCEEIAKQIRTGAYDFEPNEDDTEPNAYHYLQDALDIEYVVNSKGEYLGARILVAFGGPNIWINTRTGEVEGYWWSNSCRIAYGTDALGLDDACEELWSCR